MSSRSQHMVRKGVRIKWIKRNTFTLKNKKRKLARVAKRRNRPCK